MADLVHPEIVIKRIGVDHDKREALPGDYVIDFDPISYTVRQRPLLPENGISSNQRLCRIPDLSKTEEKQCIICSTMNDNENKSAVRLDKWLWAARFFKTRSLAAQAVSGGKVHLNSQRAKPARELRSGDELSIRRGEVEWSVVVRSLSRKRGPASEAAL